MSRIAPACESIPTYLVPLGSLVLARRLAFQRYRSFFERLLSIWPMSIEARLRQLESNYRAALSATVVAKANYLALVHNPSALSAAVRK